MINGVQGRDELRLLNIPTLKWRRKLPYSVSNFNSRCSSLLGSIFIRQVRTIRIYVLFLYSDCCGTRQSLRL